MKKNAVEEANIELTEEEQKETARMNERETLDALFKLGNFRNEESERKTIELKRNGATVLSFRIRPISEEENDACLRENSTYKKDKRTGIVTRTKTDQIRYRSHLIYMATIDEDKYIWENRTAWDRFSVLSAPDLISAVLTQGEKTKIIEAISAVSGYGDDYADDEETAKN